MFFDLTDFTRKYCRRKLNISPKKRKSVNISFLPMLVESLYPTELVHSVRHYVITLASDLSTLSHHNAKCGGQRQYSNGNCNSNDNNNKFILILIASSKFIIQTNGHYIPPRFKIGLKCYILVRYITFKCLAIKSQTK